MKKMVSATNNDATKQIMNVWSFMIMPWAMSVIIKWPKKEYISFYVFFSLTSFETAQEYFSQVQRDWQELGQIVSILPRLPAICLAADREKVYINR